MNIATFSGEISTTNPSAGDTIPSPGGMRSGSLWKKAIKNVSANAAIDNDQILKTARRRAIEKGTPTQIAEFLANFTSLHRQVA